VVVEEFLTGEEASFFCSATARPPCRSTTAQDHKRVGEGDTGPNTGGMGAYSPARDDEALIAEHHGEIIEPTMRAHGGRGHAVHRHSLCRADDHRDGPKLIEYNVRFGDPECQVLMMRLKDDIVLLMKGRRGRRACLDVASRWRDEPALTVVLAAKGYPGDGRERLGDQTAQGIDLRQRR
jgi:phosphoribosylamine--glycine ligase